MTWQMALIISVAGISIILIVLIFAVKFNKNVTTSGEIKGNKFGLSISSDENAKEDNDGNKDSHASSKDMKKYYINRINILKLHPLFTSIINHILYKSEPVDYRTIEMFKLMCKGSDENDLNIKLLTKTVFISSYIFGCYAKEFKQYVEFMINSAIEDTEKDDLKFDKFFKYFDNFINDIENNVIVQSIINNSKMNGFDIDDNLFDETDEYIRKNIPQFYFDSFHKRTKDKVALLYRDLIISRTSMVSSFETGFDAFVAFLNGLTRLLDSINEHLFSVWVEVRLEFIVDVCKQETKLMNSSLPVTIDFKDNEVVDIDQDLIDNINLRR